MLTYAIVSHVPQGSILRPFLFNILICNIFRDRENAGFSDYTEANTLYAYSDIVETVLESLLETKKLFQ